MSSQDIADSIRRIVNSQGQTIGYEQSGLTGFVSSGTQQAPYGARPDLPGARGQGQDAGSGSAGIASPLTESTDANGRPLRDYHATQIKTSADGLFVLPLRPIKTLRMADANRREVVFEYAEPKNEDSTP